MVVLGIWDGHDAGAALVEEGRIIFAVNEERLSRRKLDVGFPSRSIRACLAFAGLSPSDITEVAANTTDPAKTLTRLFPGLKEEYYLIRRRKKRPGPLDPFKKRFKYFFTEIAPNRFSTALSRARLRADLCAMGFRDFRLLLLDHHECHAQAAARCSGFKDCLVLTIDGVGDGLSGSIWTFRDHRLNLVKRLPAKVSLGILFEHVTNLMNMRELEDEGKVMALANYAYPVEDEKNPLMKLMETRDLDLLSRHSSWRLFRQLRKILWQYPSEQFAYMAQRALEKNALALIRNALSLTGDRKIAAAGGVFSNIKLNMKIAEMKAVSNLYVFPHMGDGGLALGAAMAAVARRSPAARFALRDLYLGPAYTPEEILSSLHAGPYPFLQVPDPAEMAAQLILKGEIILWFQGRMEVGPRALGNRSILARPDDRGIKDRLNMALKKRVWYQPFCPSLLREDAPILLETGAEALEDNPFMTTAFRVRREELRFMEGVINIDGTCRPHFVGEENPLFRRLLLKVKEALGKGVVLNTSFNLHGDPMVCTPDDAIRTLRTTGIPYLFLEDYLVENRDAEAL